MRAVLTLVWLAFALALLAPLLRRLTRRRPLGARVEPPDELVKDLVCNTYVVKTRALTRLEDGEVRYYCSAECARRAASR